MWYYVQSNQKTGPVPESELKSKLRAGVLSPSTKVWKAGMADWVEASHAGLIDGCSASKSDPLLRCPSAGSESKGSAAGKQVLPSTQDHQGRPLDPESDFFVLPNAEIGTVLSAHSGLRLRDKPISNTTALRGALVLGLITMVLGGWLASFLAAEAFMVALILLITAVPLIPYIFYERRRCKAECTYVGTLGVERVKWVDARVKVPKRLLFLYESACELRSERTKNYVNGAYTGTNFRFRWTDPQGRSVFEFSGNFFSYQGEPAPGHLYWFGVAAERAWNQRLLTSLPKQLDEVGFVQFNLLKGDYVRVGAGWFEFRRKGEVARILKAEIASVSIKEGWFHIRHKDTSWFSRKGKYDFRYSTMANADLFFLVVEKLLGYRF